ncbi:MAG: hypothetical protein ABEJ27_05230 [Halodesulfurarchaeum sp.]
MVGFQIALLLGLSARILVIVGLFGGVLSMVFGMGYLLIPSYVGVVLSDRDLPGAHLVFSFLGMGFLVGAERWDSILPLGTLGKLFWSAGVLIFVLTLVRTVAPPIPDEPDRVRRLLFRPRRPTRAATGLIPVALGYLIVGTVGLLSTDPTFSIPVTIPFHAVVHLYGAGFSGLLIFALGIRLLAGFFHVTPPKPLAWLVLGMGGLGPGILAGYFFEPPWFLVGASIEFLAMVGYAVLVSVVVVRTDTPRIGIAGIGFGAIAGVAATGVSTLFVFGAIDLPAAITVHMILILEGFLFLTIVGYTYQFFPVTNRQFRGATERTALGTILAVVLGIPIQLLGEVMALDWVRVTGGVFVLCGLIGYAYLVGRRQLQ